MSTADEATDAGVIVAALRIIDAGCKDDLPDWVMPGVQFAAWNGYLSMGEPPALTDAGRKFLDMFGPCYREETR